MSDRSSQPRPPVARILETSLYVSDLARSADFYDRLFGWDHMLADDRMIALAVPNREVLLLFRVGGSIRPSHSPVGVIPPHDGRGTQHLCFSIARADLDAWRAHLAAEGVVIESELAWPTGGISLYFRDPDGHSLEVATPGLWSNDPA